MLIGKASSSRVALQLRAGDTSADSSPDSCIRELPVVYATRLFFRGDRLGVPSWAAFWESDGMELSVFTFSFKYYLWLVYYLAFPCMKHLCLLNLN